MSVPPEVLAQYQAVNARATDTASTPFQQYGGQFVAPVNTQQGLGIANTNAAATEAQPYFAGATGQLSKTQAGVNPVNSAALGLAGASAGAVNPTNLDAASINKYLSPYLGDVLQSTEALTAQQNEQAQSGALGTAITSGAFGGDRAGIAAANLQQQEQLAGANTYANIANTGFLNAQGVAQQQQGVGLGAAQANRAALASAGEELAGIGSTAYGEGANTATTLAGLGAGAQTAGLQGAQAQIGAGTLEQQTQQAQDTAQYNQFLQQQSYPFQVDQFLANIAEGTGALSGSTTTTQQPGGFFSDKRLKHDVKKIGELYDGQHIVSYKMHGDPRTRIGLIAQDVEKKRPEAVGLAAGYKFVDYGKATEEAANRGHFNEGGVASEGGRVWGRSSGLRAGYDDGGPVIDLSSILAAQQQMYQRPGQNRNIPNQGNTRQLTVASGSPTPPPSGSSNVQTSIGLGKDAYGLYKHFNAPATTTTTTPGGLAPAATESSAGSADTLASLGAADAGGATGAEAAGAGAGAAGSAAAGVAGSAAVDAGAEEAAALAAEYMAADAAVALAKRGGRIGRAPGGTIDPYQDSGGAMDIPDVENAPKLQTAGPLKKQPTGLQTAISLGQPDTASSAIGGMFSNEALARGGLAGGRRGYDDGGDVPDPDMLPEQTVEAQHPSPIEYTGGVSNTDAAPLRVSGPSAVDTSEPAPKDHWWKHAENVVPLLSGLAAMGTAPTRSWGTALAAGLGSGAEAYLPAHQQQADIQARQIQNQIAQTKLDAYRAPTPQPAAVTPYAPTATPDQPLPDQLRSKYAINTARTPQEVADRNQALAQSPLIGESRVKIADTNYQNRIENQRFQNQQDAQRNYDDAVYAANHAKDPSIRASAASTADAYRQWTGDEAQTQDGVMLNKRTGQPFIGEEAQRLSTSGYAELMARALAKSPVPTGKPGETVLMPNWQIAGARNAADYVASLPPPGTPGVGAGTPPPAVAPRAAAPTPTQANAAPAATRAPVSSVRPAPVVPPAANTVDAKAFSDPAYKLPPIKRQIGLTPGTDVENQVKATAEKRKQLQEEAEQTAQTSGAALQFAKAAEQIMDSKGAPIVGLFGPAAKAISSAFGGVNATNYQEVAKYLGNLAVQSGKGNFSHETDKNTTAQFEQLSPNTAQTEGALRDLLHSNINTNQYTLDTANRVTRFLDQSPNGYNGDPQKFFRWNQEHYPRADVVNAPPPVVKSKSGRPMTFVNGHWEYSK